MTQKLKVVIDKPACCGYGICAEICPDVYKLDENGIVAAHRRPSRRTARGVGGGELAELERRAKGRRRAGGTATWYCEIRTA